MTATKLMTAYVYRNGAWEERKPNYEEFTFELWNGTHDDEVEVYGHEDGGNRHTCLRVQGRNFSMDQSREDAVLNSTRYSAAWKWGYAHAVLYGNPKTPHKPYIAVLEIAEDAFKDTDYEADYGPVSPFPYAVFVNLGFTTHLVFVDGFADLAGLMNEVLPLIGSPAPQDVEIYHLHKWQATYGDFPIE